MIKLTVLLSMCLNVISASFDYYNSEAHSLMGKKEYFTFELKEVHLKTS